MPPDRSAPGTVGMLAHSSYLHDPRVRRAAETLARAGWTVHVVGLRGTDGGRRGREPRTEVVNGVRIHRLPLVQKRGGTGRYLMEFAAATVLGMWTLARLHLKHRFDVVHVHNMPDFLALSALPAKWMGAMLVLDVHDPMSELFQSRNNGSGAGGWLIRLLRLEEKAFYRLPDRLMTVSHPMADNVAAKSGRRRDEIVVVHNAPDTRVFPLAGEDPAWPRHPGEMTLFYAGTVTDFYRLDVAVRAVALAARDVPPLRLKILGEGNRIGEVLDFARGLGVGDRVEYLGLVGTDAVRPVMAAADAGISTHQGGVFGDLYFSNKLLEFMTQGLPVLSSRTKTIARYLPEDAVFYFEPDDPADCAAQIRRIWTEPETVREKLRRARKLAADWNWRTESRTLLEFYAGCVNGGRADRRGLFGRRMRRSS